ncbi:hypothetical protein [Daejeonella lutea]|uniref:Uncharacterized protein n=1 Tax=Daejeonella lutea TaxID=572036 RepID=A0A1T5AZ62_9SPHI|nr:hypothetical protein [Daejeonella lutea]SKB40246.1 hypothetical protein SAMN05661099_1154 [Daejeonella lutea]
MKTTFTFIFAQLLFLTALAQMGPNYINKSQKPNFLDSTITDTDLKFDIIGAAGLFDGLNGESDKSLGKGSTGVSFYKEGRLQGNLIFSLQNNSTIDFTGDKSNGGSLLLPGNGGHSFQFDLRSVFKPGNKWGYNTSFIAASVDWRQDAVTYKATPLSLKAQLTRFLFNHEGPKSTISATADLGLSYRGFKGDASTEDDFKQKIFGTTKTGFWGGELNVDLWFNDTHFFFALPVIGGAKIKGLTNGQVTIGGAISGKLFKDIIN